MNIVLKNEKREIDYFYICLLIYDSSLDLRLLEEDEYFSSKIY